MYPELMQLFIFGAPAKPSIFFKTQRNFYQDDQMIVKKIQHYNNKEG